MKELPKHPSGRPIRHREEKKLPIFRSPGVGPYIPRLQQPRPTDAIGFRNYVIRDEVDDE